MNLALADRHSTDSNANTERNFRQRGEQGSAQVPEPVTQEAPSSAEPCHTPNGRQLVSQTRQSWLPTDVSAW